ncbi:MAG: FkbM family methyltransferase [Deltaproteobacteria bacterium]|nr:FkbM family methyltransferase [Deltaproteobacteria bacterium]
MDLLKVDVEGYELEALRGLKELRWKCLFIEVSEGRVGSLSLLALEEAIRSTWGERPRLVW